MPEDTIETLVARGTLPITIEGVHALTRPRQAATVSPERIAGMLLGLAIGDALGNTTEGQVPRARRAAHGEIRTYLPNRYANNRRVGVPSDDTQLAFWTLECLLADGRVVPEHLAAVFARRPIFGIGKTVRAFVEAMHRGAAWEEASQPSAGNGAAMRIAPVVLPHLRAPSEALWADAILAGAVTHNDPSSIGACVALAGMFCELIGMTSPPHAEWWLDAYCIRAQPLEAEAALTPRHPSSAFRGPIWRLVDTEVRRALRERQSPLDACERWYSGAFLLETIPSVLYILARHANDPEEAIVRAVNDTKDNDTIAALVGAAVGALHGRAALPRRWIDRLTGRTGADDDGRVFALVDQACQRWAIS